MRTVFLDLETTGLDPQADEIVEIGILDEDGEVLLDTLVHPVRHRSWPGAQRVHGIAPADVQHAPTHVALRPRIIEAVSDALVVIYNAPFDAGFLRCELEASAEVRCAMHEFAEVFGEWSDRHGSYRWQKLHVAASYVGFDWDGASHRAINDCQATRGRSGDICVIRPSGPSATREPETPSERHQERSSWLSPQRQDNARRGRARCCYGIRRAAAQPPKDSDQETKQ